MNNRQRTFTNRLKYLFDKAFALCIHCGASIAILVLSSEGEPYAFADQDIVSIINRFIRTQNNHEPSKTDYPTRPNPFKDEYLQLLKELKIEERLSLALAQINFGRSGFEGDAEVDSLGLDDLKLLAERVERLRENVVKRVEEVQKPGGRWARPLRA
ncbi:hypothetical protein AMTR_s00159p00052500 [Amborella trichopoda]|uniref:MADS-box domain-containing protein n=2 Tax=Amborella trichopoda TaxID=13333 RepID=W1PW95_AMBTC|nr:hypothetical protein AMTR_s00159p00052500 [Amborella trichopoda]